MSKIHDEQRQKIARIEASVLDPDRIFIQVVNEAWSGGSEGHFPRKAVIEALNELPDLKVIDTRPEPFPKGIGSVLRWVGYESADHNGELYIRIGEDAWISTNNPGMAKPYTDREMGNLSNWEVVKER